MPALTKADPAQHLLSAVSAGLIAGIRTILGSATMVMLVMPVSLPGGIGPALDVILIGGAVLGALVALLSSYPGVVAQVQDGPAVIIGVMATGLPHRCAAARRRNSSSWWCSPA